MNTTGSDYFNSGSGSGGGGSMFGTTGKKPDYASDTGKLERFLLEFTTQRQRQRTAGTTSTTTSGSISSSSSNNIYNNNNNNNNNNNSDNNNRNASGGGIYGDRKYMNYLMDIARHRRKRLPVELDDVVRHFQGHDPLCLAIERNTLRYVALMCDAVDRVLETIEREHPAHLLDPTHRAGSDHHHHDGGGGGGGGGGDGDGDGDGDDDDAYDMVMRERLLKMRQMRSSAPPAPAPAPPVDSAREDRQHQDQHQQHRQQQHINLPRELLRRYEVTFLPRTRHRIQPLRSVRSGNIGNLVSVRGVVTRCSDVKAELKVATYVCDKCTFEVYQEVNARVFMPLVKCPSESCKKSGSGNLHLQTRGSKFVKFQELKLQEMTDEVPTGSIPRALTVFVRGELTRQCSPGDQVTVAGVFLPRPITNMNSINKQGPVATTYVLAMNIRRHKKRYDDYALDSRIMARIRADMSDPRGDMYSRLANSLAPEIYGHEDVKKALLLMLVGGVTHEGTGGREAESDPAEGEGGDGATGGGAAAAASEGRDGDRGAITTSHASMKIRGDINICLMGDPGVAKSQMLRYIAQLSPRGIYTTGKGSSGVGLTAAVVKDTLTGELVLEGGALVLADNGICCIDEFDKMEDYDRTALHEVMEQQSISIAKAGITTTLNARASVLAAANPAYSRYNPRKSPSENINLPPALLSRFDLLFLMLDKQDDEADLRLARHITHIHKHMTVPEHPETADEDGEPLQPFDANYLRCYISHAKRFSPYVPEDLTQFISNLYVQMREQDGRSNVHDATTYTTPRTLLAILRLAQALAKLRFSGRVSEADVSEAKRLMEASKLSLIDDGRAGRQQQQDPVTQVYDIIRSKALADSSNVVRLADLQGQFIALGLGQQYLDRCLQEYEELNIWQLNGEHTLVTFLV